MTHNGPSTAGQPEQPLARVPLLPAWLRVSLLVLAAAGVAYLSLSPASRGPPRVDVVGLEHAIVYAVLSLATAYALAGWRASPARKAIVVFALAMSYGTLLEVGQLFRPTRAFELADLAGDALGAAVGASWCLLEPRVAYRRVRLG